MYSIKHLQYLVAVAEEKSFSTAATRCNVTQSTLSLGIQELERQMDLILFERSRKNIIPTPAGKKAIIHARDILSKSSDFQSDMMSMSHPNAGPLRVGVIPTIAPYFLPQFLPRIESKFPDSQIHIAEDTTEVILNKIVEGKMDLGVLALPVNTGDLETSMMFEEDFMLASHQQDKILKTISLENISDIDLLLLREGHCLKDHILSACKLPPEKQSQFFEAESLQTLLAMVNQGYGITLLPDMAVKSNITASYPNVQLSKFTGNIPTRQIGLVWRRTDLRRQDYLSL